jgi:micrococcal nuclease
MTGMAAARTLALLVALVLASVPASSSSAAGSGRFSLLARVTGVVDGDTLTVRLSDGRRDRVRGLGIDSPELGACYFAQATMRARSLAGGRHVRLSGDARQATRDRFRRRLAYVALPNGTDLGRRLLAEGLARVLVVGRRFTRYRAYVATENAAKRAGAGMWTACARAPHP